MTKHVALVFPGRRYGPEMPVLHYPVQALRQLGAEVHAIEYPQPLVSADAPTDQQWEQALELIGRAVAEHAAGAARVTLLAKSLGTRVLARLTPDLLPADSGAVWLTPIFVDPVTAQAAAARTWRSLYVYGTADPACNEAVVADVVAASHGSVVAIDGGDHSLEVEGDVAASLDALVRVTTAVHRFASAPRTGC